MKHFYLVILGLLLFGCSSSRQLEYVQNIGNLSFDEINKKNDTYLEDEYFYMKSPMVVSLKAPHTAIRNAFEENNQYFSMRIKTKVVTWYGSELTIDQEEFAKKMAGSISKALLEGIDRYDSWVGGRYNETGALVYDAIIVVRVEDRILKKASSFLDSDKLEKLKNKTEKEIDEFIKSEVMQ